MLRLILSEDDPFSGTWKLKSHRSNPPVPAPVSWIQHIEADAKGIRVVEEIIAGNGGKVNLHLDAKFDGQDYPVHGSLQVDTIAYQRQDRNRISGSGKKGGRVIWKETVTVSEDGKILTLRLRSPGETPPAFDVTVEFEKIPTPDN